MQGAAGTGLGHGLLGSQVRVKTTQARRQRYCKYPYVGPDAAEYSTAWGLRASAEGRTQAPQAADADSFPPSLAESQALQEPASRMRYIAAILLGVLM